MEGSTYRIWKLKHTYSTGLAKLAPGAESQVKEAVSSAIPLKNEMGRKWDIAMVSVFLCTREFEYGVFN
jgi:hypothetical protein